METKLENFLGNEVLVHRNLRMVALLSSSIVLEECSRWKPDGEHSNYPGSGILSVLRGHVNWAPHGFINALQPHVEIIYAYQEAVINDKAFSPDRDEAILICRALNCYQDWKEQIIKREKLVHGECWGDATGFNTFIWKFMDLQ